jgi:hypothetical protein
VILIASDTPASKKVLNAAGQFDGQNPCHYCGLPFADFNTVNGYHPGCLPRKGHPSEILRSIFDCKNDPDYQKCKSWEDYGFRYSEIMKLAGFDPSFTSPLDPMHNSFLGLAMSFVNMLFKNHLLPDTQAQAFRDTFSTTEYPSHLGRVPKAVAEQLKWNGKGKDTNQEEPEEVEEQSEEVDDRSLSNQQRKKKREEKNVVDKEKRKRESKIGGNLKADHWKRIVQLLPLAMFNAWRIEGTNDIMEMDERDLAEIEREYKRERNAEIVAAAKSRAPGTSKKRKRKAPPPKPRVSRDRREWYKAGLGLSAALRTLHAHYITEDEAIGAVETLAVVARKLLSLNAHLTINWHAAMHYAE